MKKIILSLLLVLTLFITGCNKEIKDDISDANNSIETNQSNGHGF